MLISGDNMGTRNRPPVGRSEGLSGRGMGQRAPCQRFRANGPHFDAQVQRRGESRRHGARVDTEPSKTRSPRRHGTYVDTSVRVGVVRVGAVREGVVRAGVVRVAHRVAGLSCLLRPAADRAELATHEAAGGAGLDLSIGHIW